MAMWGNKNDVWSSFDPCREAKGVEAANESAAETGAGQPDMFGGASVAAE